MKKIDLKLVPFLLKLNFIFLLNVLFFFSIYSTSAYEKIPNKVIDEYKMAYSDFLNSDWDNEYNKLKKCFSNLSENPLYTDRLIIEKTCADDILGLAQLLMNPEVTKYLNPQKMEPFKNLDDAMNYVKQSLKHSTIKFTVKLKNDSTIIGNIGFHINPKKKQIFLGYYFGKEYHGKGYASESVASLAKKVIDSIEFGCFSILYKNENIASEKLTKKVINCIKGDALVTCYKFKFPEFEGIINQYTSSDNKGTANFSTEILYNNSKIKCLSYLKGKKGVINENYK